MAITVASPLQFNYLSLTSDPSPLQCNPTTNFVCAFTSHSARWLTTFASKSHVASRSLPTVTALAQAAVGVGRFWNGCSPPRSRRTLAPKVLAAPISPRQPTTHASVASMCAQGVERHRREQHPRSQKNQTERARDFRTYCGKYGFLLLVARPRVISAIEGNGCFRA